MRAKATIRLQPEAGQKKKLCFCFERGSNGTSECHVLQKDTQNTKSSRKGKGNATFQN